MKCEDHPNVEAIDECAKCKKPLCGFCANFTNDGVLCERCNQDAQTATHVEAQRVERPEHFESTIVEAASGDPILERRVSIEESIEKREKLHMGIVIFSVLFIGWRLTTSIGNATPLSAPEIRAEEVLVDRINQCATVFWDIAGVLQNGEIPDESMFCRDSADPNIVVELGDDVIIRHPHPGNLGYSEISVSRSNPIPSFVL